MIYQYKHTNLPMSLLDLKLRQEGWHEYNNYIDMGYDNSILFPNIHGSHGRNLLLIIDFFLALFNIPKAICFKVDSHCAERPPGRSPSYEGPAVFGKASAWQPAIAKPRGKARP